MNSFEQKLKRILENNTKYQRPIKQMFYHLRLVKKLGKRLGEVKNSNNFTENEIRYLYENFPRLESFVRDDGYKIARNGKVRTFKGFSVYYLALLEEIRGNLREFDHQYLKKLIDVANSLQPYPTLCDSMMLITYIRCALCHEICKFYLDGCNKKTNSVAKNKNYLENLFRILDETSDFGVSDCLASNPAEKLLMIDKVYAASTEKTKASFRHNLEIFAKQSKIPQHEYVKNLQNNTINICEKLRDKPFGGQIYVTLHVFLTLLFTGFLCAFSPFFLLSAIPVYRSVKILLDRAFSRFVLKKFTVPSLDLDEIPDTKGVLVTVTTLVTNVKDGEEIASRLEKMYFTNGGKNIYFAVLCDLCDSVEKSCESDDMIIEEVAKGILNLRKKYGEVFFLFVRDRHYSQSEECYSAPERKRGAVNALCSYLCGKSDEFSHNSIKMCEKLCHNVRYVFTLDSDTNLGLDCVKRSVGFMLHPCNIPVYDEKRKRIVKGFGILQPRMSTSVTHSSRTFFSAVFCGQSGIDSYSDASYDMAQALFGKGVFCGKGIFDKYCFYEALCGKNSFEKERILSHDAPEGALLRCCACSDITLTDGFPKEQMSYNKRRHRWIRGDVQNLCFMGTKRKNAYGQTIINGIDAPSKYLMFENVADALVDVTSFLLVLMSLITDASTGVMLVSVATAPYALPFVKTITSEVTRGTLFKGLSRIFYSSYVTSTVWSSFFRFFYGLSAMAQNAYVCADGVLRGLYRGFISRKNTLQWTTAAQSDAESGDGILGYVKKNLFSAFLGVFAVIISDNGFVRLIGLMWLAFPVIAYRWGKPRKKRVYEISTKDKNNLMETMNDMWDFFESKISQYTNFLPCDNVSFKNAEKWSYMTSPTNIGLYLVSACCALKSEIISEQRFNEICIKTLDTVVRLPKYKGLLYNWYDVRNLEVLKPRFVSSVDIGNFSACLYCLLAQVNRCGKYDDSFRNISKTIQKLLDETDYSAMFNSKRKLFYIGFTVDDGNVTYTRNCYDMLMSETRILSYIALSHRKVPYIHDKCLARTVVGNKRFFGIASWSGTVFEYFMPAIFIPTVEGSLSYEALNFAFHMNVKMAYKDVDDGIFGISESCFNNSDDGGNYMYHAFGNEKMALCVFPQQQVISPYSSFLMLEINPEKVLYNLEKMKELGMYGKFGFYESCDFERHDYGEKCGIVKCFMSHHVGMSMCGIANFLFDGYVRELFLEDKGNASASELYEMPVPSDVYTKKNVRRYYGKTLAMPRQDRFLVFDNDEKNQKNEQETSYKPEKMQNRELKHKKRRLFEVVFEDGFVKIEVFIDGKDVVSEKAEICEKDGVVSIKTERNGELCEVTAFRDKYGIFCAAISLNEGKPSVVVTLKKTDKSSGNSRKKECIMTECEGVLFDFGERKGILTGFSVDNYGKTEQGMCFCDKNMGQICFDDETSDQRQKQYVFVFGYAKSFDGVHRIKKRFATGFDTLAEQTRIFYKNHQIFAPFLNEQEKRVVTKLIKKHGIDGKYVFAPIPIGDTSLRDCAERAICLECTSSVFRKYVAERLCDALAKCEKYESLLICMCFACYCLEKTGDSLENYLEKSSRYFRLVMKSLAEFCDEKKLKIEEKELLGITLDMMSRVCIMVRDEAALDIIEGLKTDFMQVSDGEG